LQYKFVTECHETMPHLVLLRTVKRSLLWPISRLCHGFYLEGKLGNTSVKTGRYSNRVSSEKKPPLETAGSGMGRLVQMFPPLTCKLKSSCSHIYSPPSRLDASFFSLDTSTPISIEVYINYQSFILILFGL
jgi:hypothetical protein